MIPKVIHYCWFGGNPLDEMAKKCISSWKKYCPDYKIIEWNENNFNIANSCKYVQEAYQAKKWAFVTDYVRLYVLYNYGGIYMDTDVELLKNIDIFLENESFSGFEDYSNIPTAIMGSIKGGEWMSYLLSHYINRNFILSDGKYDLTTNVITITNMTVKKYNVILDNSFQNIDNKLALYPKDYFCPKDYRTGEIKVTKNTYCIHHFNASWHDRYTKILHDKKIYFIQKYGEEGEKRFYKWYKKNFIFIFIKNYGLKKTLKKIWEKFL